MNASSQRKRGKYFKDLCFSLLYIPQVIIGDLDSVRNDVRDFYQKNGTLINKISSQDNTDFEKTIIYIKELEMKQENFNFAVFAMGAFGGRMDQTLSNIHVLSKYTHKDIQGDRLYALMDKNSIMIMLKAGGNII